MKQKKMPLYKKITLVVGILFIPVIYGLCYLQAYWNPYNNVDKLPLAVVNQDSGAVINGKQTNLGSELVTSLKKDNSLECSFVDANTAKKGVEGNRYYAVITIPQGFSKDVSSASGTVKKAAEITYEPNQKHSYIASLMLRSAVTTIVGNLKGNVDQEITANLVKQLTGVPGQLQTLGSGLDTINSGAESLQSGIGSAQNGQRSLASGIVSLSGGLNTLSGGASKLSGNLGVFDSALGRANIGAQQLSAGTKGLQKLSSGITSLNTAAGQLSAGLNTLAAQFGTGGKTPTLRDNIDALNGGAASVAGQFQSGSTSNLKYLVNSVSNETSGAPAYVTTVNSLVSVLRSEPAVYTGMLTSLASADAASQQADASALVLLTDTTNPTEVSTTVSLLSAEGITSQQAITAAQNNLANGGASITQAVSVLSAQFSPAASGQAPTLYDGVTQLSSGTAKLAAQMAAGTAQSGPTLYDSVNRLASGAAQLSGGTAQLTQALPQLSQLQSGAESLSSALGQLNGGATALNAGAKSLAAGAGSADAGANALVSGSSQLSGGMDSLQKGASQLASGVSTADKTVKASVSDANSGLSATKGLDTYAQNPVSMKETDVDPVSSYGIAFAPFFLSLSLWVGALMMFFGIHFDWMKRIKLLTPQSDDTILRTLIFLLIGVMQALVLGVIIQHALALHIANLPLYYASCILFSLVSVSIIQFLIVHVGDLGKLITILLLIFSLTSCGGTFPVETVTKFYASLNAYLPMTYSIDLMRQAIIEYHAGSAALDIGVEIGLTVLFSGLTILLLLLKAKRAKKSAASVTDLLELPDAEEAMS